MVALGFCLLLIAIVVRVEVPSFIFDLLNFLSLPFNVNTKMKLFILFLVDLYDTKFKGCVILFAKNDGINRHNH